MRVLHVHDIVKIPPLIVKHLRKRGVEADFAEETSRDMMKGYDIVHAHYALNRKTIRAFLSARKLDIPFVMHCHGSDVRRVTAKGRKQLPFHYKAMSKYIRKRSSKIFLSTPDMIEFAPEGEYLPNPVDVESFRPMPDVEKTDRVLICGRFVGPKVLDFVSADGEYDCVNIGDMLEFPKSVRMLPAVPYGEFPIFLNRYREMIGTMPDLVTMTRLDAMACGLKTFTDFEPEFFKFYEGQNPDKVADPRGFVLKHHDPEKCAARLIEAYEDLCRGRP
ncbi:MAG: hypothetical protein L0213_00120 [Candidatus Dadabacteria bacterium]|nr:hypothetical protein [Candidatus Dadabacteria bacterium]